MNCEIAQDLCPGAQIDRQIPGALLAILMPEQYYQDFATVIPFGSPLDEGKSCMSSLHYSVEVWTIRGLPIHGGAIC